MPHAGRPAGTLLLTVLSGVLAADPVELAEELVDLLGGHPPHVRGDEVEVVGQGGQQTDQLPLVGSTSPSTVRVSFPNTDLPLMITSVTSKSSSSSAFMSSCRTSV